jgi:putative nucleotidyltransferase with HDIG domain
VSHLVEEILASAGSLKPFPRAAQRALELLNDPMVSAGKLVEVLALDVGLTATVLKAANSAALKRSRQVDDVRQALALMGNERFRELVFASASVEFLAAGQAGYQLSAGDLWKHSVATSLMTEILAAQAGLPRAPVLFTAALLHDLGKSVLGRFVKGEAAGIFTRVAAGASFLEAEREVLGVDHAELGARIAERWNFSAELVELIRFHHAPQERPASKHLAVLHVANALTQLYGVGPGVDSLVQRADEGAVKLLGLRRQDLEASVAALHGKLGEAETMLGMATSGATPPRPTAPRA